MFTTPLRIVLTAVLIVEAIGDGDEHNVEKRHVSILARLGQLPSQYQGKRVEKSSLDELAERLEEEQFAKRYLGALARTGDLRIARDQEEKRDEFEGLVHDLEGRRTRLDALRDDLFHEEEELPLPEEKRSMAALARAGALPKRVLDEEEDYSDDMSDDKRGISSIARNGYYQKRMDDDLEQLMSEVYGIGEKRTVASLARGFSLPQGKRNIASIVRGKKDSYEETNEEKRNLPSIVRDRTEPLGDKRHIGSFVANHGIPFVNEKRNVGALAKNRDYPYALKFGKRSADEEVSKRQHVATLLRQGRLPSDHASETDEMAIKDNQEDFKDDVSQIAKEDAEHSRTKREAAEDMDKRYFGVRGGGKMPGGRLPKVGSRSRNRHENSGRRRH